MTQRSLTPRLRWGAITAGLALAVASFTGCAGTGVPSASGEITVYAAASLRLAFDEIAVAFAEDHPDISVRPINYDGSSTLALQIIEGAPVDVFASADERNMEKISVEGLAGEEHIFATNTLTLIAPNANRGEVKSLADLGRADLTVILCAVEVPCGKAAEALLQNAGITPSVDSYEQNVTAVLTKIKADEADAGLVYITDAYSAPEVTMIPTDGADAVVNRYPITALSKALNPAGAQAFVDYVRGEEGQKILAKYGFGK